jgi:uncharacterized protein YlxW (UPF0749 family)
MTEVTRWKTIATIAIAFSAGNLFATACGGGGGKANAQDGDRLTDLATALASTEAAVAALQDDVSDIKCVLTALEDDGSGSNTNRTIYDSTIVAANNACGI